jgi:uncharacterized protein involved in response to NO
MAVKSEPIPRYKPFDGPVLFRQGFRPFFLGAGIWAFVMVAVWLPVFRGEISIPTAFAPPAWHAHEMIFGFVIAALAGFLLTAIPNWTGRMPLQGYPLMALFAAWAAGRAAVCVSGLIGAGAAAVIDLLFLAALLAVVAREIVAGRHWRGLPFVAALAILFFANALTHAGAFGHAQAGGAGNRLGIGMMVFTISLIGGRIIPSFTRNWLMRQGEARMPASFGNLDRACLVTVALAGAAWAAQPENPVTGALLIAAGLLSVIRLARWGGERTAKEPLVWSLHAAYLWLAVGLALTGLGVFFAGIPPSSGPHAMTAGAMGSMTLAVMTRAIRGHTGRELTADALTTVIYVLVIAAAACRVAAPFTVEAYFPLLYAAAVCWCGAFGLFAVYYGRMLAVP